MEEHEKLGRELIQELRKWRQERKRSAEAMPNNGRLQKEVKNHSLREVARIEKKACLVEKLLELARIVDHVAPPAEVDSALRFALNEVKGIK